MFDVFTTGDTAHIHKIFKFLLHTRQHGCIDMVYGVSARALTPYPGDLNHCRSCTLASEDGLIESPKHVRQKEIDK
jgi:hypothetical protein